MPSVEIPAPDAAWPLFTPCYYIDLRPVGRSVGEAVARPFMLLERALWAARQCLPDPLEGLLTGLYLVNPDNTDVNVLEYMACYALDGLHSDVMGQFSDALKYGRLRKYHRNGLTGRLRVNPPARRPGDGYFYYTYNLDRISLPALVLADAMLDLTDTADIEDFFLSKTRNALDEFHVMPGTAHLDMVNGLSAPFETFPLIGRWLDRLCTD